MGNILKSLFGKKVIISLVILAIVSLFTYSLYHSDIAVSVTGNIIKSLAGR